MVIIDNNLMYNNFKKLTELFNNDIHSQFINNNDYMRIKELFHKNNETLLDYFNKCIKLIESSIYL